MYSVDATQDDEITHVFLIDLYNDNNASLCHSHYWLNDSTNVDDKKLPTKSKIES